MRSMMIFLVFYLFLSVAAQQDDFDTHNYQLVMKIISNDRSFKYSSNYWTEDNNLNPNSPFDEQVDAKYAAFNNHPFQNFRICVDAPKSNCFTQSFDTVQSSALALFRDGGTITDASFDKLGFTDVFGLTRGNYEVCANKLLGFNQQCAQNNWARFGYCKNCQGCSDDSDSVIGIGLKATSKNRSVYPNNGWQYYQFSGMNAGVAPHFDPNFKTCSTNSGGSQNQKVWVWVGDIQARECEVNDKIAISNDCKCGEASTGVRCESDKFCVTGDVCLTKPLCDANESKAIETNSECFCKKDATSVCSVGSFCWVNGECKSYGKCQIDDKKKLTTACQCEDAATTASCLVNSYCVTGNKCIDDELCTTNYFTPIKDVSTNTDQCYCGTIDTSTSAKCTTDRFCWENECKQNNALSQYNCQSGTDRGITYAGKIVGEWLENTDQMKIDIKTPHDITVKSISWLSDITNTKVELSNTDLKYDSDATTAGLWKFMCGRPSDECKNIYDLTVTTKKFFGDGSDFSLTFTDSHEYELRSALKVEAEQHLVKTVNGHNFEYTRTIINNMPILVKLQTKTIVHVSFTTVPQEPHPLESHNFVIFVGFEEDANLNSGKVIVKMESYSNNGIASINDGGISMVTGDVVPNSAVFKLTDHKTQSFSQMGDYVVDYITWEFVPTEAVMKSNTASTYTLQLKDKFHTSSTWTVEADVEIAQEDILTTIGFHTKTSIYSDSTCENKASTFERGDAFYVKIELSKAILEIATIECSTFKVRQYTDKTLEDLLSPIPDTTQATVTKDFKAESTRFSFTQHDLKDKNGDDIKDTWVCGGELDSIDFLVSKEGHPTQVELEVTITHVQDDSNVRRILSIPIANSWTLNNAEQFSSEEIQLAKSLVQDDGQLLDYEQENDVYKTGEISNGNNQDPPSVSSNEILTTFKMVTGQNEEKQLGSNIEVETGIRRNVVKEAQVIINEEFFYVLGLGVVFVGLTFSIYFRNLRAKTDEYTALLE